MYDQLSAKDDDLSATRSRVSKLETQLLELRRDYESAASADTAAYARFFRGLLDRGIYPPPSQFEAWFISGAHTERDIDRTIKAAKDTFAKWGR